MNTVDIPLGTLTVLLGNAHCSQWEEAAFHLGTLGVPKRER